ncbi:MAG: hypothetical protein GY759_23275 [Chloroflexi bacterium]|nr:hypothetical protein [Chloroflexota bacterium]
MNESSETRYLRTLIAILRIVLGIIILATWWENQQKGLYSAQGISDLFTHPDWGAFTHGGGSLLGYQAIIENTVLQVPGAFGALQMVGELLLGLALLVGGLTPLAAAGASFFFLNLLLTYAGHSDEWIWSYVLLLAVALVVMLARAGRSLGIVAWLAKRWGRPPLGILW